VSENRLLYDEMCSALTDYEGNGSEAGASGKDLYDMLVKIQNRWEYIVTSSTGTRGILADWLAGTGPFMCKAKGYNFTLMRVRKNADFDYLYTQRQYNGTGIVRDTKFEYAGIYFRRNGLVYDCQYNVRDLFDAPEAQDARSEEALLKYLKVAVRSSVETTISNDRNNLRITELSDQRRLEQLEYYQQSSAMGQARKMYLSQDDDCGDEGYQFTFQCEYRPEQWTEDSLLAYILDPDGYVCDEANKYFNSYQEVMLSDFLKGDIVVAAYNEMVGNPSNPIHYVKGIMRAVSASSAKTVTVTIHKDGKEFTFKTEVRDLCLDCTDYYSDSYMMAADRRKFEELFGRYPKYRPEDIVRIEYARSVLYEKEIKKEEVLQ